MVSIRRIYIYIVATVSLLAASIAVISLLQNLVPPSLPLPIAARALLIAVIVIALPFYLGHWFWAQRLAARETDERASVVRRIYLYVLLAVFLGMILGGTVSVLFSFLRLIFGLQASSGTFGPAPAPLQVLLDAAVTLLVAVPLWLYHELVRRADARAVPDAEHADSIRRFYIYYFAAEGLLLTAYSVQQILRFILYQFGGSSNVGGIPELVDKVETLVVGAVLWLVFWNWAQFLFKRDQGERASALRKLYLYVVVFASASAAVIGATFILAGLLRAALGLRSTGDIRDPISIIVVAALVWAFHAFVLRQETNVTAESERQASLRRLYWYLVAAIGLAAFLIGLGGDLSVLIRAATGEFFGDGIKEQLAWFTAALIAGLPIWLLPWWRAQRLAVQNDEIGAAERRSTIRKIYLYFYLLVATLTMLGCAIFVLSRLLTFALGDRSGNNLFVEIVQPLAFALIGAGVWVYHIYCIRLDGARHQAEQAARRAEFSVAIVDSGQAKFGHALITELNRILPGLTLIPQGFAIQGTADAQPNPSAHAPNLVVGAWTMLSAAPVGEGMDASPVRKLIVPTQVDGADWVGVDATNVQSLAKDAGRMVKRVVEGETTAARRGMHPAVIVVLALVGLCVLLQLLSFLSQFVARTF